MKNKKVNQKPLTLEILAAYNQEVLFPTLEERFATKKEFRSLEKEFKGLGKEFRGLEKEFKGFKNESLTNQDAMLKKLDILLTEKTVREYRERKEKKLWAIIIKSLKEHQILSSRDLDEIARLEIF